jgi:hypothetical protein
MHPGELKGSGEGAIWRLMREKYHGTVVREKHQSSHPPLRGTFPS